MGMQPFSKITDKSDGNIINEGFNYECHFTTVEWSIRLTIINKTQAAVASTKLNKRITKTGILCRSHIQGQVITQMIIFNQGTHEFDDESNCRILRI
mgnify:CR=1 FL=1